MNKNTTYTFNKGDLVVVTEWTRDVKPYWEEGEIQKLGGCYWGDSDIDNVNEFTSINSITKRCPNGNGYTPSGNCPHKMRHATPGEVEYYNQVGFGANINDMKPKIVPTYDDHVEGATHYFKIGGDAEDINEGDIVKGYYDEDDDVGFLDAVGDKRHWHPDDYEIKEIGVIPQPLNEEQTKLNTKENGSSEKVQSIPEKNTRRCESTGIRVSSRRRKIAITSGHLSNKEVFVSSKQRVRVSKRSISI